jgi:hypothetical protein
LSAAEETEVGVANNDDGMIEIYADDIRKFTRFAGALIERLA